jgi:shikimate kinase
MARVLVTGMSGAGKTTVLDALAARGHRTVDTDYDGWTLEDGRWDEPRVESLLVSHATIAVSGTVDNQARFYGRFDHVVLLSAPLDVLLDRVRTRTTNPYGRAPQHEAQIRAYVRDIEPLLRAGATVELDGRLPVAELADVVEDLLTG